MTDEAPAQMDRTYPAVRAFLDKHIIQKMAERSGTFGPTETAYGMRTFVNEWITYDMARAILRDLWGRGLCFYAKGLMTEDGEVAGAGYGLTKKGLEYYDELCPKEPV